MFFNDDTIHLFNKSESVLQNSNHIKRKKYVFSLVLQDVIN